MAVPKLVVVLLCVLGAGAVVVAFSAFGHHFFWKRETIDAPRDWNQVSLDQGAYMKRVRELNLMGIYDTLRADRNRTRQSGTTGTVAYYDGGYEQAESSASRMNLHGQAAREVHSGYESSISRYNSNPEKNGVWVNDRTV